jgi:hypothetical protein
MSVTKSQVQNITSPNGNSLAVFVDGITGIITLKDVNGKTEPLSNYVCSCGGGGTSPFEYNANATGIQPILGTNDASGQNSFIGGGFSNTASNYYTTVGGGYCNIASGNYATIGGGNNNTASCNSATVGGGYCNIASSNVATVGGGFCNTASGNKSSILGGANNTASCNYSTVGGGQCNTASFTHTTVGGGQYNNASNSFSTVGGGRFNTASNCYATIGGGRCNNVSGSCSSILGGCGNTASFLGAVTVGGFNNCSSNENSVIVGGQCNCSLGKCSFVGGGFRNIARCCNAIIVGGQYNDTCTFCNVVIVGTALCATQNCTAFMNCASVNNLTIGCAVAVGANKVLVNATPKIGSFFSTQSQSATTINTPKAMTLNNTDAFSSGVSIVSNSQITVDATGIYNLQFSAQIDRVSGSGLDSVDIWYRVQGVDAPNTNTKITIAGNVNESKTVASWNFFISLTAGQYVELMYSVTDLNLQILYETANLSVPHPATPSVILTIQKIN